MLDVVLAELEAEGAIAASEIAEHSPELLEALEDQLGDHGIPLQLVPHTEFKQRTRNSRAAVRSAGVHPYANVILVAGVVY